MGHRCIGMLRTLPLVVLTTLPCFGGPPRSVILTSRFGCGRLRSSSRWRTSQTFCMAGGFETTGPCWMCWRHLFTKVMGGINAFIALLIPTAYHRHRHGRRRGMAASWRRCIRSSSMAICGPAMSTRAAASALFEGCLGCIVTTKLRRTKPRAIAISCRCVSTATVSGTASSGPRIWSCWWTRGRATRPLVRQTNGFRGLLVSRSSRCGCAAATARRCIVNHS